MIQENIVIKSIKIEDHFQIVSELMRLLHENEREMFDKTALWVDIEQSYMRHCIATQQECNGTFLMAYINETAVGFIFGYTEEQDDSRTETYTNKELYISDGFVLPKYRRQGIYKQLNEIIERIYIEKGVRRITRFVQCKNEGMQNLLAEQGYFATRILFEKWL